MMREQLTGAWDWNTSCTMTMAIRRVERESARQVTQHDAELKLVETRRFVEVKRLAAIAAAQRGWTW